MPGSGESKWITGEPARAQGHALRARNDAVVVGSGTVLADDPELTCRLPGLENRSPVRVVFDGRLRTPLTSKLVATAKTKPEQAAETSKAGMSRRRPSLACSRQAVEGKGTSGVIVATMTRSRVMIITVSQIGSGFARPRRSQTTCATNASPAGAVSASKP